MKFKVKGICMKYVASAAAFLASLLCTSAYAATVSNVVFSGTETIAGSCSAVSLTVTGTVTGTIDDGGGIDKVYFWVQDDADKKGEKVISVPVRQTIQFSETIPFGGTIQPGAPGVGVYLYDSPERANIIVGNGNFRPTVVSGSCTPPKPTCPASTASSLTIFLGQPTTLQNTCPTNPGGVNRTFSWNDPDAIGGGVPTAAQITVTPKNLGVTRYSLRVCDAYPGAAPSDFSCDDFPTSVTVLPTPSCPVTASPINIYEGASSTLSAASCAPPPNVSRSLSWSGPSPNFVGTPRFSIDQTTTKVTPIVGANTYYLEVCDSVPSSPATKSVCLNFPTTVNVVKAIATPRCVPTVTPTLAIVQQPVQLMASCQTKAADVVRDVEWVEGGLPIATGEAATISAGVVSGVRTLTLNVCDKAPKLAQSLKSAVGSFTGCDATFTGKVTFTVRDSVAVPTCAPVASPNPVVVGKDTQLRAMCSSPQTILSVSREVEWIEDSTALVIAKGESANITAGDKPSARNITMNVCDRVAPSASARSNKASIGGLTGCEATATGKLLLTTVGIAATCSAITPSPTGNRPIGSKVTLTATCSGNPAIATYTWADVKTNAELGKTTTNTFDVVMPIGGVTVRVTPDNGIAGATGAQITLAAEAPVVAVVAQPTVTMVAGDKREFKVIVRSSTGVGLAGVPVVWTDVEQQNTSANAACGAASGTPQTVNTDATGTATINYTFPPNSCGRTLTASVGTASTSFKVVSAATTVTQPAQQAVQAIAQIALVAPQVQLNNIRSRQEQLRNQGAQPKVKSDLRVSASGTPIPISAIASLFDGGAPATGLNASGDDFERWGVFLNGDVELGSYNASNGFKGFDARSRGITFGADYRFDGNHAIGIGLGAARSKAQIADAGGQQESRGTSVSLFGTFVPTQDTYIDGTVLFGRMNYEIARTVLDANKVLLGSATAKPDGNQMAVALSAGANFNIGSIRLNPYGRFERISATIGGFAESGPQALLITEQKVAVSTVSAGAQVTGTFNTSFAVLQPNMRLEFNRNIRDSRRAVFASLVNDADPLSRFALATALDDKSYGTIGIGMSFLFQRGISAFVQVEESFASETAKRRRYSFGVRVPL